MMEGDITPVKAASLGEGNPAKTSNASARVRYDFLDGIRGLSALWVVLYHIDALRQSHDFSDRFPLNGLEAFMARGYVGVPIFILLSGFCLALPLARSKDRTLRGGLKNYFYRRGLRILPAYYAAMGLGLISTYLAHLAKARMGIQGDPNLWRENFHPDVLVSHFLLIHNLSSHLNQTLNPAMWSVGLEWQIYFVFALILVPVWRYLSTVAEGRFSLWGTVCLSIIIGYLPLVVLPKERNLAWCAPWLVGVFGLGMIGGLLAGQQTEDKNARAVHRRLYGAGAAVGALLFLMTNTLLHRKWFGVEDWLVALTVFCGILFCVQETHGAASAKRSQSLLVRFLESRGVLFLGRVSYSLYLTHFFILFRLDALLTSRHLSPNLWLALMFIVGIACCLGLAFVFYRLFELPFMALRTKTDTDKARDSRELRAAAVSNP